jgi:hypothetical protein
MLAALEGFWDFLWFPAAILVAMLACLWPSWQAAWWVNRRAREIFEILLFITDGGKPATII